MSEYFDDPDDVECAAWAQPEIHTDRLPRMKLDVPAMRAAARDIVREPFLNLSALMRAPETDSRLVPHIVRAIVDRNREKELKRV